MIVENSVPFSMMQPDFDIDGSIFSQKIQKSIIVSVGNFVPHIKKIKSSHKNFNENQYTQEFVAILNQTLRFLNLPFCAAREYSDIHTIGANTKRTVDFYFHPIEFENGTKSIFSVEAKRLPAPSPIGREKEYVIGENLNEGGIERFKNGEHGKGLSECGMLAFVEENSFEFWLATINKWIAELSSIDDWEICGQLKNYEYTETCAKSYSIVGRTSNNLTLFHFWILV